MPESPTGKSLLLPFLRGLLDDVNQNCAVWIDKPNGIFKLVDPHRVAKLWGVETGNPKMNYDKMSRGLRDHYNKNLKKVSEKGTKNGLKTDQKRLMPFSFRVNKGCQF
ncbi:hypothetical protein B9Z55_026960 [Caenorhabditis nigoni]|uniref:ETS domain-containing protein n=1 Tax=Caenorhabditis nigoni TaxID=1611254 RepID=A0A2G5SIS3_9PELO|nr:hypothetical protein B9Z55_026960 [Caenorhabditis nigoni]